MKTILLVLFVVVVTGCVPTSFGSGEVERACNAMGYYAWDSRVLYGHDTYDR